MMLSCRGAGLNPFTLAVVRRSSPSACRVRQAMLWSAQDVSPLTPTAPTFFPLASYSARPPPKTFVPPTNWPTSGSCGVPYFEASPPPLPLGCTCVQRFAVDSASTVPPAPAGRLRDAAVLAFCAEITRLAGHWLILVAPVKVTAQTFPS